MQGMGRFITIDSRKSKLNFTRTHGITPIPVDFHPRLKLPSPRMNYITSNSSLACVTESIRNKISRAIPARSCGRVRRALDQGGRGIQQERTRATPGRPALFTNGAVLVAPDGWFSGQRCAWLMASYYPRAYGPGTFLISVPVGKWRGRISVRRFSGHGERILSDSLRWWGLCITTRRLRWAGSLQGEDGPTPLESTPG
jgi:hypothetical protein